MNKQFQVKLSGEELVVVAALLGYESIFGIKEAFQLPERQDLSGMVRACVAQLERSGVLAYRLDGTLQILPELRQAMACLCQAQSVGIFSTNLRPRANAPVYVMERKGTAVILKQSGPGRYAVASLNARRWKALFPEKLLSAQGGQGEQSIPLEEAEQVQRQIQAFDREGAEQRLSRCVPEKDTVKRLAEILSGSCGYFSVQIYRNTQGLYRETCHAFLALVDGHAVSLELGEDGMLTFASPAPEDLADQLRAQFQGGAGRRKPT